VEKIRESRVKSKKKSMSQVDASRMDSAEESVEKFEREQFTTPSSRKPKLPL
jgi:hypothetical protein